MTMCNYVKENISLLLSIFIGIDTQNLKKVAVDLYNRDHDRAPVGAKIKKFKVVCNSNGLEAC